jgi:hypothetical protein
VSIQECFYHGRDRCGTLDVQHVPGAGDADHLGTGVDSAQGLDRAIGAQACQVVRPFSQHHEQRSADFAPSRLGILALVENGIDPVMTRIGRQPHAVILIADSPNARDERRGGRRKSLVAKLYDGGQLLEGVVALLNGRAFDLIQPFAHALWRVLRRGPWQPQPFEIYDAAYALGTKSCI